MKDYENYRPGGEPSKSHKRRVADGIYKKYLSGDSILDIGGGTGPAITPSAKIVDVGYPEYDGLTLPFEDCSQDAIFSSHCLEHVDDPIATLKEWFRVIKLGGFIVLTVPHQYLYEKKLCLPSRWNADHKRFYTPALLLNHLELALEHNTYRIRSLLDNDAGFDYSVGRFEHSVGCYEIELVIEKISENNKVDLAFTTLVSKLKANVTDGGLALCGAGDIGMEIFLSLKNTGLKVDFICDKNKRLFICQGEEFPVHHLAQAMDAGCNKYIIASHAYRDEIQEEIIRLNKGTSRIYFYFPS